MNLKYFRRNKATAQQNRLTASAIVATPPHLTPPHLCDAAHNWQRRYAQTALTVLVSLTLFACSTGTDNPQNGRYHRDDTAAVTMAVQSESQQLTQSPVAVSADADAGVRTKIAAVRAQAAEVQARYPQPADILLPQPANTENYADIEDNRVIRVADQSTSTFSIDVDTGAYSNVRRWLQQGAVPPKDAVRVEELINYFAYDYTPPEQAEQPFAVHTELGKTPWNANTRLLHVGLKGFELAREDRPSANLVFLVDVSGSMHANNKLPLLKSAIKLLSRQLDQRDRVALVVYAGASGVVLEPTPGNDFATISAALDQLRAGGSTNGAAGIELAYTLARQHFNKDGVNRVLLATDGDFNVGIADVEKLTDMIERERKSGIALSTLGLGTGNYNDHLMEQLADTGNGSYAYIDTMNEAHKVLVEELTATLVTIASDVKIQIEFNPAVVSEYRLLGYVNRRLANEDFRNDKVDAGEIGAGHTVTALYEIALHGDGGELHVPSRYQRGSGAGAGDSVARQHASANLAGEVAEVRLRYKLPGERKASEFSRIVTAGELQSAAELSDNYHFSAAVAAFGQMLRGGRYLTDYDYQQIHAAATAAMGEDTFGYRREFLRLIDLASALSPRQPG